MDPILDLLSDPVSWLVIAGGATQAFAHIARDQVVLRTILLAGTSFYVAYYALVPGGPLWPAILTSCAIGAAGVIGLLRVLAMRVRRPGGGAVVALDGAVDAVAPRGAGSAAKGA